MTVDPLIGRTLSHYRIVAKIGEGGMGEVYRAHDTDLGRDVALKVLPATFAADPDRVARFEREAKVLASLNHPNIAGIYGVEEIEGRRYLALEYVEGESLEMRLLRGAIPVEEAVEIGLQIASGMEAAHEAGIIHRDLKPGNVMITPSDQVKVVDFGLAKGKPPEPGSTDSPAEPDSPTVTGSPALAHSPVVGAPATLPGVILGTAAYLSPEQARGRNVDRRADIWSFGCVFYECLTGQRAFKGETVSDLIAAILKTEVDWALLPKSTPSSVRVLLRRCLEKDPKRRLRDMGDVRLALVEVHEKPSTDLAANAPPRRNRKTAVLIAATALTGAAVGICFWNFGPGHVSGRSHQPTYHRLTFRRGWVSNARFARDGRSVVYSASWDGSPSQVCEVRTDLSSTRDLNLTGMSLWSLSAENRLAIGPETRVDYDEGVFRTLSVASLSGEAPRKILEDVSVADWSPDGRMLAIARSDAGHDQIEMPPGHVLARLSGYVSFLRVSGDGRSVAFAEHSVHGDTRGHIGVVDRSGAKKVLTPDFDEIQGLAWSKTCKEVWYCGAELGEGTPALRAVTLDGRWRTVLRSPVSLRLHDISSDGGVLLSTMAKTVGIRGRRFDDSQERELGWLDYSALMDLSDNGERIVFEEEGTAAGNNYTTYLRSMDGSPPVKLGEGTGGKLSPDGKWVLVLNFARNRLMALPTGPGGALALPTGRVKRYVSTGWMPDSKEVVFVGVESGQVTQTYIQALTGGEPRAVLPPGISAATTYGVFVSPDRRFVAVTPSGSSRLMLYPLAGGTPRYVGTFPREDTASFSAPQVGIRAGGERPLVIYCWDANGHMYAARFVSRCRRGISRISVETGQSEYWKTFGLSDSTGSFIMGFRLARDGRSYAYGYMRILNTLFLAEGLE